MARHAQITQNNKFAISLQYLKKDVNDETDGNWTRTQNHLVLKRTLTHLPKQASLAKWIHSQTRRWHDKNIQSDETDVLHADKHKGVLQIHTMILM